MTPHPLLQLPGPPWLDTLDFPEEKEHGNGQNQRGTVNHSQLETGIVKHTLQQGEEVKVSRGLPRGKTATGQCLGKSVWLPTYQVCFKFLFHFAFQGWEPKPEPQKMLNTVCYP